MSIPPHRLAKMTWPEAQQAARERRVVLIPVGTIEQHGHHLPIDTDNVIADSICDMASKRAPADLVLAPLIPYGYNAHTMGFPGTVSISPTTFVAYCFDVCASLARHEFKYLLLVNGHGSNQHLCEAAARQVVVETRARCATLSWWSLVTDVIQERRESEFPGGTGHADEVETSVYLHLDPGHVQMDLAVKEIAWNRGKYFYRDFAGSGPLSYSPHQHEFTQSGVAGDATVATAVKGECLFDAAVTRLIEAAREFREIVDRPPHSLPAA
jgi:creatinine amidohydrolase